MKGLFTNIHKHVNGLKSVDSAVCLSLIAATEGMDDVLALRAELERVNRELAQTSAEKIQSAQYGLVLLVSVL